MKHACAATQSGTHARTHARTHAQKDSRLLGDPVSREGEAGGDRGDWATGTDVIGGRLEGVRADRLVEASAVHTLSDTDKRALAATSPFTRGRQRRNVRGCENNSSHAWAERGAEMFNLGALCVCLVCRQRERSGALARTQSDDSDLIGYR